MTTIQPSLTGVVELHESRAQKAELEESLEKVRDTIREIQDHLTQVDEQIAAYQKRMQAYKAELEEAKANRNFRSVASIQSEMTAHTKRFNLKTPLEQIDKIRAYLVNYKQAEQEIMTELGLTIR